MTEFNYNIQKKLARQQDLKIELKLSECFNTDTIYVRKVCTGKDNFSVVVTNCDLGDETLCIIPVEEPYNITVKYINQLVRKIVRAIEV